MHLGSNVFKPLARCGALVSLLALVACGGGGGGSSPTPAVTPPLAVTNSHAIGGAISGLTGTVELQNNGGDTFSTSTDGNFSFAAAVDEGSAYAVTVSSQPVGQTCTVNHGSGTVGTNPVTNVAVVCATNAYSVGGSISNLPGSVTLQNNRADDLTLNADGAFTFASSVAHGANYNVTVQTHPMGATCTVSNGSGTMGASPVINVAVICNVNTYAVGGTVSGLVGSVSLQNNGADTLTQNTNGAFTFATPVASGSAYDVTVSRQPASQTCSVGNGAGNMVGSTITNVAVICVTNTTTLQASPTKLVIPVGGAISQLTVSNTGSGTAFNVQATLPAGWTGVTQDASNCASIARGASCTIWFTSTTAYVANGAVAVAGSNTHTAITATAFSVDGFLVFDVTGANTGWVIDNADLPSSTWSSSAALTNASSLTDGAANTDLIVAGGSDPGSAASACRARTGGGHTWSLPALCQMRTASSVCSSGTANIHSNLITHGFGGFNFLNLGYWTSNESGLMNAYMVWLTVSGSDDFQVFKHMSLPSRCIAPVSW